MKEIISTTELLSRIQKNDERLIIIDVRSFDEYLKGHIPNSVNLELMQFHWIDTKRKGIKYFNRQTIDLFSFIGIKDNIYIIFYDNISGPYASRGIWLSHYLSHDKAAILNGGFNQWKKENKPIEMKTNSFKKRKYIPKINPKILADYQYVKKSIKKKKTIIIDSRSNMEFNGEHTRAARNGHIKSAINIEWKKNIKENKFKEIDELREIYRNIPKNKEIITYCQGAYRAANTYVILKMLGYKKVKMYLGSWNEWGNKKKSPIEK
ncbi:MAG: sulfurtransferase [Nitrososphaeraceae archaeon]